jgi:hypothetical protein
MRVVYEAENVIDAHLVKGLLENNEIPAFVRGEYLVGAVGELPVMGLVAVLVPESQYEAADTLLREFRGQAAVGFPEAQWDAEPDPA